MTTILNICRIDCASDDAREAIGELRRQLSPTGNVVSPQGRARTIAAFGEPLTPQQVVERICADVQCRGLEAVLDYTARLDGVDARAGGGAGRARRAARGLQEGRAGLPPHARAGSATTSWRSRSGILNRDATLRRGPNCELRLRYRPLAPGRRLHPRRGGGVSVVAPDDGRPGAGGGGRGDRRGRAADAVRRLQRRPPGRLPRAGGHRGLPDRRCAGRGGPGLRGRGDRAGGQDRRAGQPVRRAGQAAGLRRGRYRQHRRAERGRPDRRLDGRPALRRRRPDQPGRALAGRQHPDHLGARPDRPRRRGAGRSSSPC